MPQEKPWREPPQNGWWRAAWDTEYLFVANAIRYVVKRQRSRSTIFEAFSGEGSSLFSFKRLTISPFATGYRKELKIICEVAAKLNR